MGFGPGGKVFEQNLASGVTIASSAVNLDHAWDRVYLEIPTFASGGTHYIQGSDASDGTFRRLHTLDPADGGNNEWIVAPSVSQVMVPVPAGFQYYKVETTSGSTDTTTVYRYHVS